MMNTAAIIVEGLIALMFVALGLLLSSGKGAFLIAGYNTMKKEKKEKYDEAALCKFMGKMMFALSFCAALWALGEILNVVWIFYAGFALFFAVLVFALVYANTGGRFKN